jgi:hypothetical protein
MNKLYCKRNTTHPLSRCVFEMMAVTIFCSIALFCPMVPIARTYEHVTVCVFETAVDTILCSVAHVCTLVFCANLHFFVVVKFIILSNIKTSNLSQLESNKMVVSYKIKQTKDNEVTVEDSSISRVVEILQCFAKPAVLLDYSLEVR